VKIVIISLAPVMAVSFTKTALTSTFEGGPAPDPVHFRPEIERRCLVAIHPEADRDGHGPPRKLFGDTHSSSFSASPSPDIARGPGKRGWVTETFGYFTLTKNGFLYRKKCDRNET